VSLSLGGKEMWMKQGDEIRGKQNLGKKTKAAFQLGWFPFFQRLDL